MKSRLVNFFHCRNEHIWSSYNQEDSVCPYCKLSADVSWSRPEVNLPSMLGSVLLILGLTVGTGFVLFVLQYYGII